MRKYAYDDEREDGGFMNIYLAPLEGITGFIYRNAIYECFGGFDKYFIPFISPNQKGHFSTREKKDVMPEHNRGMYAVPQIMTNCAEDFLRTVDKLEQFGYKEVNLNLGCPSRTVVTKGRGAGFLAYPDKLDRFLDEIFRTCRIAVSVKTRIGVDEPEEFETLLKIYNRYPLNELIIHPRVQQDFYKNTPRMDVFEKALETPAHSLCYNGDLATPDDCNAFRQQFPAVQSIMLGRGALRDPSLARQIRGGAPAGKEELRKFHDQIYRAYCEEMSGDRTVLYKMKELWCYMGPLLPEHEKYVKKIRKCEKCAAYDRVVDAFFRAGE